MVTYKISIKKKNGEGQPRRISSIQIRHKGIKKKMKKNHEKTDKNWGIKAQKKALLRVIESRRKNRLEIVSEWRGIKKDTSGKS